MTADVNTLAATADVGHPLSTEERTAHEISAGMRECIDNCLECARSCRETLAHCLAKGGKKAEASHIRILIDCAVFCDLSASLMLRGSEFHADVCRTCADVCKACEECEEFSGDATLKACKDACRHCADSCRRMGQGSRTGGLQPGRDLREQAADSDAHV